MALNTSIMTGGSNNHQTTSEEANGLATDFVSEGIVGTITNTTGVAPATGGFAVNASGTPDANVQVSAGVAYVTGTPTSQNSQTFRVKNTATAALAISANSSGSTKYDWIYIKLDATLLNTPTTAGDTTATIVASRSSSASTDDGTPPTYGYPIAVVTVANGFTTITNSNIRDVRTLSTITATSNGTSQDWYSTGYTFSSVTANGNRSYSGTVSSADLTSFLSKGMRLRGTRTVAAPTQCTDLEASSSQYYSRTSAGLGSTMTFTDDFVVSAWVKLESYPASSAYMVSRSNNTSGWGLFILSTGQVGLVGFNGSTSNFSQVLSYQSLPLGKWVHISAQLDMSAFTATTTTSYTMIDGVDVPAAVSRGGTNPTALVQAGDFNVGAFNNAASFYDGKIAQVAIYSAKVTQATIRASMNQTLSGSETSLVSAYSFNNSIVDLNTTNANNLSANGSAVATNSDSPFTVQASGTPNGTTDYGIITDISFSTNTTVTFQVPEGNTFPTSGGISALAYSTQKAPYGFPASRGKWKVKAFYRVQQQTVVNTTTTALTGAQLTLPTGDWIVGENGSLITTHTGIANLGATAALSTSTSQFTNDLDGTRVTTPSVAVSNTQAEGTVSAYTDYSVSSQTVLYLVGRAASNQSIYYAASSNQGFMVLEAEPGLL